MWDAINTHALIDVPQLLIDRYITGVSEEILEKRCGVTGARVSQLCMGALERLAEAAPESMQYMFGRENFRISHEGRGSDASRTSARQRWASAPDDVRRAWGDAIKQGKQAKKK